MKRIFEKMLLLVAVIVTVVMCFAFETSAAITGSGTQDDPYIINTTSDLSKLRGSNSYFKLGQNVALNANSWDPASFYGVLDGDGYTLEIYRNTQNSKSEVALFGENKGTVRNLNVQCDIYHKFYTPSTSGKMGGICITNKGIIESCNVLGSLNGNIFNESYRYAYIGGICRTNSGTIRDCGVYADVIGTSSSTYCKSYVGGICETNEDDGIITRCVVKNYIMSHTTSNGGGGIARFNEGTISECCVASCLSVEGNAIANGGTVENCINFSTQYKGTAIGSGHTNCINAGEIRYSGTIISESAKNSYDIGDQELLSNGYGLPMSKTYTKADFPALDFEKIWYITDYGVPYLRSLNLPKPQSVNLDCEDKLYVGGETWSDVEILPKNAVLYSLSVSYTNGEHGVAWGGGYDSDPSLIIRPVSAGNTRLVISDAVAGALGFKNFNFIQGVESITVTGPTRMAVGQTIKLTAVASPSNAENTRVKFVAPDSLPRRLTVSEDGTVKANYLGDAWLYVKSEDGNVTVRYDIVVAKLPTKVTLSESKAVIYPGEVRNLSAKVTPEDSEDKSHRWESSNPGVATVDADGKVTPVSYGTAIIRAVCNDGGAYGECEVTVAKRPQDFILNGPDTIDVGETATYELEALPADAFIRETYWQVDNGNVAKVEQINLTTVKITGIAGGKTQIQLFTGEGMMYSDLNVIRHPDSVKISENELYMTVGQQKQLNAEVSPEDTTDKTTTWTSDNEAVASVSPEGKITAHAIGEATISCITTDGKKRDQALVRVQIPASSLEVEETDITLYVDEIRKINATVRPGNATYKNVVLTPNNNLLEVDQNAMSICGVKAGTCILQVSTPDGSLTKNVFVTILKSNHVYSDPVFTWNADYTKCTAQRTCVNACPHSQTYNCTVNNTQYASTCNKEGRFVYTATVRFDGTLYNDTKNVTIPKGEHNWKAATCTAAKKCTACDTISGSKLGHTYSNACDKTCNRSGCEAIRTGSAHKGGTASCTAKAKCTVCGASYGSLKSHTYSNACDKSCNVCKATRVIKHTYKTATTKATLKKNGKQVTKCTVCGDVLKSITVYYPKTIKLEYTTATYNGKAKKPKVTVKDSKGNTLKKDTDYTVKYSSGRKNSGKYTVTVTFKGKYEGTKKLTFTIKPATVTLSKVTAGSKQLTATWKTVTGVTGYEVQYSTSSKFTSKTTKKKTVKSAKTKKTTIKKLKKGKKYYVKVRAYKTVDGKKIYGGWSSVKSVKVK